jgi:hypothetical protein
MVDAVMDVVEEIMVKRVHAVMAVMGQVFIGIRARADADYEIANVDTRASVVHGVSIAIQG